VVQPADITIVKETRRFYGAAVWITHIKLWTDLFDFTTLPHSRNKI